MKMSKLDILLSKLDYESPQMDVVLLTDFLFFGISAVIHGTDEKVQK